jgi:hypothetical protein
VKGETVEFTLRFADTVGMFYGLFLILFSLLSGPLATAADGDMPSLFFAPPCDCCTETATASSVGTAKDQLCRANFQTLGCEQFLKKHPEDADDLDSCPNTSKSMGRTMWDLAAGCGNGVWDTAKVIGKTLVELITAGNLDEEIAAREDDFRKIQTADDKRSMLGALSFLFKDEEIKGHGDSNPKINCKDPINQNYCYGYSAATLYRLMLERVTPLIKNKTLDDQWIPQWSITGEKEKLSYVEPIKSFSDLYQQTYGVRYQCFKRNYAMHTACAILAGIIARPLIGSTLPKLVKKIAGRAAPLSEAETLTQAKAAADLLETRLKELFPEGGFEDAPLSLVSSLSKEQELFTAEWHDHEIEWPLGFTHDDDTFLTRTSGAKPNDRQLVLTTDNSLTKKINEIADRQDYTDALNNKFKDIFFKELKDFKAHFPNFDITAFSDWKGVRFLIQNKLDQPIASTLRTKMNDELGAAYKSAVEQYVDFLEKNKLTPKDTDPKHLFISGIGSTADRANLAARFSKVTHDDPSTSVFEDAKVELQIRHAFETTELVRSELYRKAPGLFIDDNGLKIPPPDAFDLARKYKDPRELRNILSQRFSLKGFGENEAKAFLDFTERLNVFSPSVLTAPTGKATLLGAEFGGFRLDLAGQGGQNLYSTARALQSLIRNKGVDVSKIDTESFIQTLRRQDLIATASFNARTNEVVSAVSQTLGRDIGYEWGRSGDDMTIRLLGRTNEAQRLEFLEKLSGITGGSGLRVTYIHPPTTKTVAHSSAIVMPEVITSKGLDNQAQWAEGQEKALRKSLEGIIPYRKMRSIVLSSSVENGKIKFNYHYRKNAVLLTENERRRLQTFIDSAEQQSFFDERQKSP